MHRSSIIISVVANLQHYSMMPKVDVMTHHRKSDFPWPCCFCWWQTATALHHGLPSPIFCNADKDCLEFHYFIGDSHWFARTVQSFRNICCVVFPTILIWRGYNFLCGMKNQASVGWLWPESCGWKACEDGFWRMLKRCNMQPRWLDTTAIQTRDCVDALGTMSLSW